MAPNTDFPDANPGVDRQEPPVQRRNIIMTGVLLSLLLLVAGALVFIGVGMSGDAAAQADYYNDSTASNGTSDAWFGGDGNATLGTIVDMVVRAPTYIIGTGEQDPSGTGFEGVLLTGLLMVGASLGAIVGVGVGPVGGSAVGLTVGFGVARAGFAPAWFRIVMLFGLGILVAMAIRRAQGGR